MEDKMNYINLVHLQWAYLINVFLERTKLPEQFSKYTNIDLYDVKKKYLEFVKENKINKIQSVYFIGDLFILNIMEDILLIMTNCSDEDIGKIINGISTYFDNITGKNSYNDLIAGIINDEFDTIGNAKKIKELLSSQNRVVSVGDENWNIVKDRCRTAYSNTCETVRFDKVNIISYYLCYIGTYLLFKMYGVKVIRKGENIYE